MKLMMLLSAASATILTSSAVLRGAGIDDPISAPITRAELRIDGHDNAQQAIQVLRPQWLAEDPVTGSDPVVYIELRCTELTCLRWLGGDQVEEIRYSQFQGPVLARQKASKNGVIVVTLGTSVSSAHPGDRKTR